MQGVDLCPGGEWLFPELAVRVAIAPVVVSSGRSMLEDERRAVRCLLGAMLGVSGEVDYQHDPSGAPLLVGADAPRLSVSHCRSHVAVALSEEGVVGVDVERLDRSMVRVVPRYLTSGERALVESLEGLWRERVFALLWSAKEAVYKLVPSPRHSLLDYVVVELPDFEVGTPLRLRCFSGEAMCMVRVHYAVVQGCVVCLALPVEDDGL